MLDGISKGFRLNANHSQSKNNVALQIAPNRGKIKQKRFWMNDLTLSFMRKEHDLEPAQLM